MIFHFRTVSGSEYEVDLGRKTARRLHNQRGSDPTPRQGDDRAQKTYAKIFSIGDSVFFDWDGEGHGTVTSPVEYARGPAGDVPVPVFLDAVGRTPVPS